uniref:Uncharacterized protein n=1 Tax=Anguilla anguilla TaxID=7936 RepID=A0A0E9RLI9_ANGAN
MTISRYVEGHPENVSNNLVDYYYYYYYYYCCTFRIQYGSMR